MSQLVKRMNFRDHDVRTFSKIKHEASYSEDNTVLLVKFSGYYSPDAEGIFDGQYMHAMLASNYFVYEPIVIILDLSELNYTGGRTILKSINFFGVIGRNEDEYKKRIVIIASRANKEAIDEVLDMLPEPTQEICGMYDTAVRIARQSVDKYLSGK